MKKNMKTTAAIKQHSTPAAPTPTILGDMRSSVLTTTLALAIFASGAASLSAQTAGGTASTVQSTARPLGLSTVAPVMQAGSDASSATFQQNVLSPLNALLNTKLGETKKLNDSTMLLDPSKLKLATQSDVRVYFVGEGAGYNNTLGFNTGGGGVTTGDPKLIFPNASSPISTYDPLKTANRTASAPLLPGDFVNLGTFAGGTKLDFFLIANGASGGQNVFSTDQSVNPDGINHVVSFAYVTKDSPYLIISFEDMYGGGDRDFNDVIIAVDIGARNVAAIMGTPEPALMLTLGGFLGGVALLKRRNGLALA